MKETTEKSHNLRKRNLWVI